MAYDYGLGLGAPVVGSFGISSPTGYRTPPKTNHGRGSGAHYGTDYRTPRGTQAVASQDGIVTRVANDPKGYGKYVTIVNPQTGVATQWAHMDSIDVRVGQTVSRGQPIGKTGNTGNSSGPHLDYTVTKNGVAIRHDGTAFKPTGKSWLTAKGGGEMPIMGNPAAPVIAESGAAPKPMEMPMPEMVKPQPSYLAGLQGEAAGMVAAMEAMEPAQPRNLVQVDEFFAPTYQPWEKKGSGSYYG